MARSEMLNPELYAVLSDMFDGDVDVSSEGEPGEVVYTAEGSKYYAHTEGGGQEFRVNCPFCGDTRGRLYISYLVGADIKRNGEYVKTYHLMYCHNEGCNTLALYKKIRASIKNAPKIDIKPRRTRARLELDLPKPNYPINSVKAHPAPVGYMTKRGFDLDELAEVYGVRTCERIPGVEHLGQMVLFPSYDGNRLSFWQARMAHDAFSGAKAPKYYFPQGSQKSETVYNRFNALAQPMVVITEGVLDAIRVGEAGVAVFGKHPSASQTRIFSRVFGRKLGVLMLDADAEKEATKWYRKYSGDALFAKGLYLCRLEDGDPADLTREELWRVITDCVSRPPE